MDTGYGPLTQEACDSHLPLPTLPTVPTFAKPKFQMPN